MAIDVSTQIEIRRSRDSVASYAADPDKAPTWYANIQSVAWRTPPPLGLGSRVDFVARFLGQRLTYTYEVIDFVPGERLVMRASEGPVPMETTYVWEALGESLTRMTLRNRGAPAGFSRLLAPLMAPAVRRANAKDLLLLKRQLEAAGA